MKSLFSSWSVRIGSLVLIPLFILLPYRQEFLWRLSDGSLAPVSVVRYRFFWNPPWNGTLDIARLLWEIVLLAIVVMVGYRFEEARRDRQPVRRRPPRRQQRRPRASAKRSSSDPLPAARVYRESEWKIEVRELERDLPPRPCPSCSRTGFYGPKEESGRHFRMCKFCGFYQTVGKEPYYLRPCVHPCGQVREIAGAPEITWLPAGATSFVCSGCREEAQVSSSTVSSPTQDTDHPWWRVPQDLTRQEYVRFWLASGAPGSVFL
jgi:hypothetical protein